VAGDVTSNAQRHHHALLPRADVELLLLISIVIVFLFPLILCSIIKAQL
jgi:hypothetical protein